MGQSAPLIPLTVVGPGFAGLNKQLSSAILDPQWALEAQNLVFDDADRLASRKGWEAVTGTPIGGAPQIEQIYEYKPIAAANQIVSAAGNKLYKGTTTLTDITGAVGVTANNWQFQNFNGLVYGLQTSHALIQWNGAGNWANVAAASGTVPDGNVLLGAFGRLWGTTANGQTLKYSALLDATHWTTGAGSFNFTSVWPTGADEIQAVASFNNFLVVFGRRNILLLTDGTGSALGINPTNTYVVDAISGIGCIARDSVQNINGDDLVFLSSSGVMSLNRVIQERSNPLRDISKNVRDFLNQSVATTASTTVRSTYNPRNGFYLLLLPAATRIFCFDTKRLLPDGSWRVTEWISFIPRGLTTLEDGFTTYSGTLGKIFTYANYFDNGATYRINYLSGWTAINEEIMERLKILKRLGAIILVTTSSDIVFKWAFDFAPAIHTFLRHVDQAVPGGEWGVGEWGTDEFGGSFNLEDLEVPANGQGQFIQVGLETVINGAVLAIQHMQLFTKVGRVA